MPPFLGFLIENSIVNSVPIFLAALVVAYIAGPFLKNVGANKYARIAIYSVIGVAAGMWSYSSFDIPDRSIELMEASSLSVGMLIYSLLVITPIVLFKNRAKQT
ncbi:MAG: hypothetical protein ACJAR0_002779 [Candidatus Azotimanducaceae bacterium]|jgi:hypothetical protein